MRKVRCKETEIVLVLKEVEGGRQVKEVCREYGISDATYYNWKAKYHGMEISDMRKLKELADENRRLKQMYPVDQPAQPGKDGVGGITVEVSRRPLHDRERAVLSDDLDRRRIAPAMLDVLPPNGRFFQLLRAHDGDGQLLGVTSLMSFRPFVSIKQMLGEGNHVGWDTSIYYATDVDRPAVAGALLRAIASRSIYYAMYFGRIDADVRAALPLVRHRLLRTDYEIGEIVCCQFSSGDEFLAGHKRLRRHVRDHAKTGGEVHVAEGPVDAHLARRFADLVYSTYCHHGGLGRWQFREYAYRTCVSFFGKCADAVHIYTSNGSRLTGLQSFVRHRDRLELSEGGFDRSQPNHHAYEAIIAQSVAFAAKHELAAVGYGGIWNPAKDRYTSPADRPPIYLLQLYPGTAQYRLFGDRLSAWAFRTYFGGRFAGASAQTVIESRLSHLPNHLT